MKTSDTVAVVKSLQASMKIEYSIYLLQCELYVSNIPYIFDVH